MNTVIHNNVLERSLEGSGNPFGIGYMNHYSYNNNDSNNHDNDHNQNNNNKTAKYLCPSCNPDGKLYSYPENIKPIKCETPGCNNLANPYPIEKK
jgi:hypothetical protein